MQKTMLYVAILVILGFGVWYFLFSGPGNTFSSREAGFTIRDTGSINKIFLADNAGKTVTLTRTPHGWLVNGYKALDAQVNSLLLTLASQQPVRPVPEISHNDVIRNLAGNAVKVEVYDAGNKLMRTFYVGAEVQGFVGTYMLMDGASRPYVVNIPGFDGYLQPRYTPDVMIWRDRTIFNIPADDITSVSVQYDLQPLNSYAIKRSGDSVSVSLDPRMQMEGRPANRNRTLAYLDFFNKVNSEGIANGVYRLDSVIRSVPKIATVDVRGKNYHQKADVYYFPMNRRSKNNETPITDTSSYYDSDHYYAVINNGRDTVTVQQAMFEKIFRLGYQFFMADPQPAVRPNALKK